MPYIAATLATSIEAYKQYADVDISANPGLSATLYNLGNAAARAKALVQKNKELKAAGKPAQMPEENYYGWLINDRGKELRSLF